MVAKLLIAGLVPLLAGLAMGATEGGRSSALADSGGGTAWPAIRELSLTRQIQFNADRIDLDVPLQDRHGAVRYRLICRGGSAAYLARVSDRTGTAVYVPELTCILNAGNRETDNSLLSEDESAAYYSRGHIASNELLGACAAYPEYGLTRHFRLRGMEVRLSFSDLRTEAGPGPGSPRLASAQLSLSVRSDPSAQTAKAEQPGYLRPDGTESGCRTVRRGNAPRMCRSIETGSWGQCTAGWINRRYPWETGRN